MLPSQGENNDKIVELNKEVEALKARCGGYERVIEDFKSRWDTHEKTLEMLQQQVVHLQDSQGTLSTRYNGENYELLP
jgi:hypothetical protein